MAPGKGNSVLKSCLNKQSQASLSVNLAKSEKELMWPTHLGQVIGEGQVAPVGAEIQMIVMSISVKISRTVMLDILEILIHVL